MSKTTTSRDAALFASADSILGKRRLRTLGKFLKIPRSENFEGTIQCFVTGIFNEYIDCKMVVGDVVSGYVAVGEAFPVARPYKHRKSSYDGKTQGGWLLTYVGPTERTATKAGETTETHKITEAYILNEDVIMVSAVVNHYDGLVADDAGNMFEWPYYDANADGRAWAIE